MNSQSPKVDGAENAKSIRDPRKLSSEGKSLYALLDVDKESSAEIIRKAYRKLALQCHPDKHPNDAKAGEKFSDLNRAYVVLSDEAKRNFYDNYGSFGIFMADQMGEETATMYLKMKNPCLRCLLITCCLLTGCCCCFCCCFCCSCFRKHDDEEMEPYPDNLDDAEGDMNGPKNIKQSGPNTSQPQPIPMPGTGDFYNPTTPIHVDADKTDNYKSMSEFDEK